MARARRAVGLVSTVRQYGHPFRLGARGTLLWPKRKQRPIASPANATTLLSRDDIEAYHRDGFVQGGRLLGDEQADHLFAVIERLVTDPSHPSNHAVFDMGVDGRRLAHLKDVWAAEPEFRALLDLPELAEALHALTGQRRFRLWQDGLFYKPSRIGSAHGWHQDVVYLPVRPGTRGTAAWVALSDVADPGGGAMHMIRGSHAWGDAGTSLDDLPLPNDEPLALPEHPGMEEVPCPMPKGRVHFHDGLTWHGSVANTGPDVRCGLLLFFLDGDAELDPSHPYAHRYREAQAGSFDPELHPVVTYRGPTLPTSW